VREVRAGLRARPVPVDSPVLQAPVALLLAAVPCPYLVVVLLLLVVLVMGVVLPAAAWAEA